MRATPHDNYKYRAVRGETIRKWSAYWLTTERFYRATYRPLLAFDRKPEHATEDRNIHTLFRKNFFTKDGAKIKRALLYLTGDDFYKVYINSDFVGEGPAQSYPFSYNYNCFDITDLLKENGENAIGVHVYYQGLFNIYLVSADNAQGMIAQLEIMYEDGTTQTVVSDKSWKCKESTARLGKYIFGYQTQFSEDINLNEWEDGWFDVEYDISGWEVPDISGVPYPLHYHLVPQITPTVKHEKRYPLQIKKIEKGFLYDFGKEYVGTLNFCVKGKPNQVIEVRCGEELEPDGRVRYNIRAGCCYQEFITLTGQEDFVDFFDYKGFRYAEILGITEEEVSEVWLMNRHYPFPDKPATFKSSDKLMNQVWDICYQGVKIGTQDTYYDCPTREKGGFIGDALITVPVHMLLTGDIAIFKKFLMDCANAVRLFPGMVCHVPTYDISPAADYSFLFPLFLEEYYEYTGDRNFISEMLPVLDGIVDYYRTWENGKGLLEHITHPKKSPQEADAFVLDWPANLRDDYDFEQAKTGVCTTINMHYYGALKKGEFLYNIVGNTEKASEYGQLCKRVEAGLLAACYNEETGLFTDAPNSQHCALHANSLQLFYGLEPPKGYGPLVKLIMEKRLNCGVYFAYFLIQGLYRIGEAEKAYELLSCKDEHSWYTMVESGTTTCMEAWGPDQKWNTSWCHPWSSSPIIFYTREILGIKYAAPGMKAVNISPRIPESIDWMEIDYPVMDGRIFVSFKRTGTEIDYVISAPEQMEIIFEDIAGINFKRI